MCASSSEEHGECSGLVGMQPTRVSNEWMNGRLQVHVVSTFGDGNSGASEINACAQISRRHHETGMLNQRPPCDASPDGTIFTPACISPESPKLKTTCSLNERKIFQLEWLVPNDGFNYNNHSLRFCPLCSATVMVKRKKEFSEQETATVDACSLCCYHWYVVFVACARVATCDIHCALAMQEFIRKLCQSCASKRLLVWAKEWHAEDHFYRPVQAQCNGIFYLLQHSKSVTGLKSHHG